MPDPATRSGVASDGPVIAMTLRHAGGVAISQARDIE
jgi:hypothetical protein